VFSFFGIVLYFICVFSSILVSVWPLLLIKLNEKWSLRGDVFAALLRCIIQELLMNVENCVKSSTAAVHLDWTHAAACSDQGHRSMDPWSPAVIWVGPVAT